MSRPQAGMNFYELLEINQSASPVEIKKAYKKLAIQWHPDKNLKDQAAAAEMFKMIGEAYEVLSDPVKRRQYDIELFSPKFPSGYSNQQQNFNFDHDNYSFDRANELFNSMFAEFGMGFSHPFSSFNDQPGFPSMFGQRNFGNGENNHQHRSPFGNFGMMGGFGGFDPFDDSSFGVPSSSGFSSFSSSSTSSFGNRPGGTSRSVSTSTTIGRDGRRVVRKEVTVISPDGSRQTTVEESVDGVPSNHQTITNNAYSNSSNSISVSTPSSSSSYQQPPHEFSNHRSGGQRLARRVSRGYDDDSRNGYSYY